MGVSFDTVYCGFACDILSTLPLVRSWPSEHNNLLERIEESNNTTNSRSSSELVSFSQMVLADSQTRWDAVRLAGGSWITFPVRSLLSHFKY